MNSVSKTIQVKKVNRPLKIFKEIQFTNQKGCSGNLSEFFINSKVHNIIL